MSIVLIGLNHQTAPVDLREKIAFTREQISAASATLTMRGLLREGVILSTCNRSEIYGVTGEAAWFEEVKQFVCGFHRAPVDSLNGAFYQLEDYGVARHLFRVASSLDSQVIGEPHILGQVREAYLWALENKTTGVVLNRLFQKAVAVGKRVRSETEMGVRPVSLSSVAVEMAIKIFGKLPGRSVLVIGAGEMSERTVESLALHGVKNFSITNRSLERAQALAAAYKGQVVPWEQLPSALLTPDIVISSTSSPQPILTRPLMETVMKERRHRPIFLIDIALPRDIEASIGDLYNTYLYNLDDLKSIAERNKKERERDIPKADKIVEEEARHFMKWFEGLDAVSTVTSLRKKIDQIRMSELEAHLRKLGPLGERERNVIDALTQSIVNKILHEPTIRLKGAPGESTRGERVDAIRYLFDLDKEEW